MTSVTFGYEEAGVVPAPDYKDASSFVGYPELLAAELRLKVANAACSGETSSSLIDASAQSNGCENAPGNPNVGYRRAFPLHVGYKGSQLAFALSYLRTHHRVRLVSLMIGANDFFVCQETTSDRCASASEQQAVAKDSAAKPFHVEIANGFGEWQVASVHSAANPCTAGLLTQLGTPGKCGIHPSYSGQSLLAQALENAIRL